MRDPSSDNLRHLADIYHVSRDYLLGRQDEVAPAAALPSGAYPIGPTVKIPVLGEIRAGLPLLAQQNVIGWEERRRTKCATGVIFSCVWSAIP